MAKAPPFPVDTVCQSAVHEAMKESDREWRKCHYVGFQSDGQRDGTTYEMRNCPRCHSSLMRPAQVRVVRYLPSTLPTAQRHTTAAAQGAA